jgi:RHS repeat-associated protein
MPLRMAGQYYGSEVGISNNYFRDYDPSTGRYVESDPIALDGGMNTYGYVYGSPLKYKDPLGLWVKKCVRWLKGMHFTGASSSLNPLTHHYLSVNGANAGLGPKPSGLFSNGYIETDENPANDNCTIVCDDPDFDGYVLAAEAEVGNPNYAVVGGGFFNSDLNCHQWVRRVLAIAIANYKKDHQCPKCFK